MKREWKIVVLPRKIRVVLALVLILAGIVAADFGIKDYLRLKTTMAEPLGSKVILIDPGHGGNDSGALGYRRLKPSYARCVRYSRESLNSLGVSYSGKW